MASWQHVITLKCFFKYIMCTCVWLSFRSHGLCRVAAVLWDGCWYGVGRSRHTSVLCMRSQEHRVCTETSNIGSVYECLLAYCSHRRRFLGPWKHSYYTYTILYLVSWYLDFPRLTILLINNNNKPVTTCLRLKLYYIIIIHLSNTPLSYYLILNKCYMFYALWQCNLWTKNGQRDTLNSHS